MAYYCREASPTIAREAYDAIRAAAYRLLKFPLASRSGPRETRECIMRRFPFTIIYRVSGQGVRIVRVLHQARRYFNR